MSSRRIGMYVCIALTVIFAALAIYYFATAAKDIPSFMPGHATKSTRKHSKYGIVLVVLAVASAMGAWWFGRRRRHAD